VEENPISTTEEQPPTDIEIPIETPGEGEPSGGTTVEEVDWNHVAKLIGEEVAKHEPKYEVIEANHGGVNGELRIVQTATIGDLLVSFLLLCVLSTHLLRWLFKTVWGR